MRSGLRAEHERIVPHALAVDLGLDGELADPVEALLAVLSTPPSSRRAVTMFREFSSARRIVITPEPPPSYFFGDQESLARDSAGRIGGSVMRASSTSVLGCRPL